MLKRLRPLNGIGETQAAVLRYLRRKGSASRAEIAEFYRVTPAAVSMMVRDLIERGMVVEGARRAAGRGAPHIELMLNAKVGYAIGVHANRYSLTMVLLDFCGKRIDEQHRDGPYNTLSDIQTTINGVKTDLLALHDIDERLLIGAGIAMPTRFRQEATYLDLAQEVIGWGGSDLASTLQETLGHPVVIENDANAAAMGELAMGDAGDHDNFVYLYLSEGIGSGIIIGKQLYRGHVGNAGEVGALRPRGLSRPSFEDLATWCLARVGEAPKGRSSQEWTLFLKQHDTLLDAWVTRAGPETAKLAFMVSAILAPTAIYVGGTLPAMVRRKLAGWLDFATSKPFEDARVLQPEIIVPENLATDAVAFGAAAMILHDLPGSN